MLKPTTLVCKPIINEHHRFPSRERQIFSLDRLKWIGTSWSSTLASGNTPISFHSLCKSIKKSRPAIQTIYLGTQDADQTPTTNYKQHIQDTENGTIQKIKMERIDQTGATYYASAIDVEAKDVKASVQTRWTIIVEVIVAPSISRLLLDS